MSLRLKILIIILLALIGAIMVASTFSSRILLQDFATLERAQAQEEVAHVEYELQDQLDELSSKALDWSVYDETYQFIQGQNPDYVEANFSDITLRNMQINFMLFVDLSGTIVYATGYDSINQNVIPIPDSLTAAIEAKTFFDAASPAAEVRGGLLSVADEISLFSLSPILPTTGEGRPEGTLILGKWFNTQQQTALSETPDEVVHIYRLDDENTPSEVLAVIEELSSDDPFVTHVLPNEKMSGYTLINDISGQPAFILRVDLPRDIYTQGQKSVSVFLKLALFRAIFAGVLVLVVIEVLIVSRLRRLSSGVNTLQITGDLSERLPAKGRDEIGQLGRTINSMVDRISGTQTALEHSEANWRSLIDNIPDIVTKVNRDGNILYIHHPALATFSTLTPDSIIGMNFYDSVPPESHHTARTAIYAAYENQQTSEYESIGFDAEHGTQAWYFTRVAPVIEDGKVESVLFVSTNINARKLIENALQESESQYRDLFENTSDLIQSVDSEGKFIYVNRAWQEKLGYDEETARRMTFSDIIHPDEREHYALNFEMLMSGISIPALETIFVTKTGESVFLEGNINIRFVDDKLTLTRGIFRDITARKLIEAELRQSQERLRRVIDNAPVIVSVINRKGIFTLSQGKGLDKLGLKTGAVEGLSAFEIYNDYPDVLTGLERALKGEAFNTKVQVGGLWFETVYSPLKNEAGEFMGTILVAIDITEQHTTAAALKETEIKYRQLVEEISDLIYTVNLEGRFTYISPIMVKKTGYTEEQLLKMYFVELIVPEWQEKVANFYIQQIKQKAPETLLEFPVLTADGTMYWAEQKVVPVFNEQNRVVAFHAIVRDVTVRKQTEEKIQAQNEALVKANRELAVARRQAEDATRLKSQFLATMSHELRTPLNAIIGYTEIQLAGMTGPLNDEQNHYQDRVLVNAKDLLRLINEVLDLSKIEAGRMDLAHKPFVLREWLEEIISQNRVLASGKGLEIVTHVDESLPEMLIGDPARLKQIVVNLLSNGIKFTEKGKVEVNLHKHGNEAWKVEVIDTGIGIPSHLQETIFDEFRQVDSSSQRKHSGTGLGLAIVRKLTLMMGGNIRLNSQVGVGSTFIITLPLTIPEIIIQEASGD